ncbi:HPr kinase/phosphorylase [Paenibacillus kobensis]|uniref:HPr kinase/phosphorylase n=1 Tax=Paenibacillus kobensis TaxID=59841 RepID=UPI000FD9CB89|nr:aldolase [Paenibacillus kobensis]
MIENKANKVEVYQAFGLIIASEIAMPELMKPNGSGTIIDLEIKAGDLTEDWRSKGPEKGYYACFDQQFIMLVPDVAIFAVQEGRSIIVSPFEGADSRMIRLYLLGTCMGMVLMQRRVLPLHGSVVVIGGQGYAFVGDSGAGKSTLAAALLKQGCPLVTDDVIAVSIDTDTGRPIVSPAYPQQKLWQSSIDQLNMDADGYNKIYSDKFAIPVQEQFYSQPIPLAGLFELDKTLDGEIELSNYQPLERLAVLRKHTFRSFLVERINAQQWHFSSITQVASQVPIYRLRRPIDRSTVQQLVELIMDTVRVTVTP